MRLFQNANFPFVKVRKVAYVISAVLLIIAIGAVAVKGLNWSTDFEGGVNATINMIPKEGKVPALNIDQLRKVISAGGFKEAEIQYIGAREDGNFQIKVKSQDPESVKEKLTGILNSELADYTANRSQDDIFREISTVGAKAGLEMRTAAIWAVLIALILMIIYIWIRFEFTFGLMGILALFHDVMLIVGIFAITGKEISMSIIAALLTIVGYSINDTIVVYDRIREDLKIYRKDSIPEVFNRAINKTLSRTVLTAGTTLLTALALLIFGGSVIHDFALAMTLGIFFGTYSSIFVASNLVIDTYHLSHREKQSIKHLTKK